MAKVEYAFRIEPSDLHGVTRIQAYAVRLTDPDKDYGYDATDLPLKDLMPQAWIDEKSGTIFGFGTEYRDVHSIDARRAEAMAKMLRKIERGLEKISEADGYIESGDFATHLLRVARVLGIKTFYVRNSREQRAMHGEAWRKVAASGVQYYVTTISEAVSKGELHKFTN